MIVGLGIDVVSVARIERALERFGAHFWERILTEGERVDLNGRSDRAVALAGRFAAKEAASKALGTGWSQGVRWRDVVVRQGPEPSVGLLGRAAAVARARGSSGRGQLRLERRGALVIGEFWLLS